MVALNASAALSRLATLGATGGRLTVDSRSVEKGDVFVALIGSKLDGRHFVADALNKGAAAVLREYDAATPASADSRVLDVEGLSAGLGEIADDFYAKPSAELDVFGVTGTNGKTSIVNWIAQALNTLSVPCGAIGTLGVSLREQTWDTSNTTPDAATVHTFLRQLGQAGAQAVAMEVSSHALELHRVKGVRFDTVVFTNLTQDHLDFHGTMAAYGAAKAKLFTDYPARHRVINADDAFGAELLARGLPGAIGYGIDGGDVRGTIIAMSSDGMRLRIACGGESAELQTRLIGKFNAYNLLAVAAVLRCRKLPLTQIAATLAQLRAAPGRMQRVGGDADAKPSIYVDYAHTPDALVKALDTVRETQPEVLAVVFGCGGDRDRTKRPIMGGIAAERADRIYVTSDNPRSEAPDRIIRDIVDGIDAHKQQNLHVQADRREAIRMAVAEASAGSAVLIAGKGHETYQEVGGVRSPFSDVDEARAALAVWRPAAASANTTGGSMWSADFLARASGARMQGPNHVFTSVSNDTRTITSGALYVALRGENFDGHRFVKAALEAGASGVLVSQPVDAPEGICVLTCADTLLALQMMGSAARDTLDGPVVAVTGSNGKTSTRQLIAAILEAHHGGEHLLCTQGNFNNHIGVPLTLLRLMKSHRAAVLEAGMNHFHELSLLSSLIRPDIAVITNAGPAHLEGVGSLAGVAKAKAEIFDSMASGGTAVLNADDYFLPYWEVINRGRQVLRFGFGERADVRGTFDAATSRLQVTHGLAATLDVKLPFSGEHNGRNALAAIAVARVLGIPAATIKTGLERATNIGGRLTRRQLSANILVIDDSYNANPASVRAGVQVLVNEPGQKILVLGDMAELGADSDALHREVIAAAEGAKVDHVLTLGNRMQRAATAAGGRTAAFTELDALVAALRTYLDRPSTVLVKGAHSMAMHRVIDRLATLTGEQK